MRIREITSLEQIQFIHDRLYEFNLSKTGGEKKEIILTPDPPRFGWYVTADGDEIIRGGLVWQLHRGNEFYIDFLWLDESLRGTGLGRQLLDLACECARSKKCTAVTLFTSDFQAPGFYRKYGFSLTENKGRTFFYRLEL